jgi:hypothetical protein
MAIIGHKIPESSMGEGTVGSPSVLVISSGRVPTAVSGVELIEDRDTFQERRTKVFSIVQNLTNPDFYCFLLCLLSPKQTIGFIFQLEE